MPNANLFTGEEILARLEALKSDIAGDTTITIAALEDKLATVEALAKGRSRAISYANNAAANAGLAAMSNTELQVGDSIYIGSTQVPDWYVAEVVANKGSDTLPTSGTTFNDTYTIGYYKLYQLETEKVDLSNYYAKSEVDNLINTNSIGSATFSDNIIGFKNKAGAQVFTVNLSTLLINASPSKAGMVKLYNSTSESSAFSSIDDGAFTPAFLAKVLQSYVTTGSFNTLSNTVSSNSSRIQILEADTMEVSLSDGETADGIMTLTWEA